MGKQVARKVHENSAVSKKVISLNLFPADHPNSLDHPDNKVFKGIIKDLDEVFQEIDKITGSVQQTFMGFLPTFASNAFSTIMGMVFPVSVDFKAEAEKVAKNEKALESKLPGITDQRTSVQIGIASVSQALGAPLMTVLTRVANALGLDKTEVGQVLGSTVSAATNSIAMSTPAGMLPMLWFGLTAAGLGSLAESLGESHFGILAGDIIKAIPTLAMQAMNAPKDEMSARAEQMAPILDRVVSNFSDATVAVTEVAKNLLISTGQIISNHTTELAFLAIAAAAKVKGGKNANLIATTALTLAACHAAGKLLGAEGAPVRRGLSAADIIPSWYTFVQGTLDPTHFYGKDNLTDLVALTKDPQGNSYTISTQSLDPSLRTLLGISAVSENNITRSYDDLVGLVKANESNFVDGSGTPNVINSIAARIAAQAIIVSKGLTYSNYINYPIKIGDACNAEPANSLSVNASDVFNLCVGLEPEFGLPVVASACLFSRDDLQNPESLPYAIGSENSFVSGEEANRVCAAVLPTTTTITTLSSTNPTKTIDLTTPGTTTVNTISSTGDKTSVTFTTTLDSNASSMTTTVTTTVTTSSAEETSTTTLPPDTTAAEVTTTALDTTPDPTSLPSSSMAELGLPIGAALGGALFLVLGAVSVKAIRARRNEMMGTPASSVPRFEPTNLVFSDTSL